MKETQVRSLGQEDPLEEEMATHSSLLAWEVPQTEEPGGLQSMGSQKRDNLAIPVELLFTQKNNKKYNQASTILLRVGIANT